MMNRNIIVKLIISAIFIIIGIMMINLSGEIGYPISKRDIDDICQSYEKYQHDEDKKLKCYRQFDLWAEADRNLIFSFGLIFIVSPLAFFFDKLKRIFQVKNRSNNNE